MRIHRSFTLGLGLAALAVAACDTARPVAETRAGISCARCHGGEVNDSGAPPRDTLGRSDPSLPSVGAHTAHVAAGLDCGACHVKPARSDDGHVDGRVAIVFGPVATAGGALSPAYDGAGDAPTYACSSVYCHGNFTGGNRPSAPVWTAAGQGQVVCGTCHALPPAAPHPDVAGGLAACSGCHPETVTAGGQLVPGGAHVNGRVDISGGHPADWMEPASAGFHALSVNAGLASCQGCHGADLGGGSVGVACGDCHDASLPPGVASWRVNCVMCHGGVDNGTGAPPRTTWGNSGDPTRVGAHTAHLTPSAVSPGFDCGVCHVKPADALAPGHVGGGTATVAFGGLAVNGVTPAPTWSRESATCNGTYCHGAEMAGATPVWTRVGQGEAACGTCHGLPPTGPHPAVTGGLAGCSGCHASTMDSSGALIAPSSGGTHLNGLVDGGGHDAAWMDRNSAGFHAFSADRNLAGCTTCHGADLGGGAIGIGCGMCHDAGLPPGVTTWAENCVMCHGGGDNGTGAPPAATWGNAGDPSRGGGTADPVRVGAHTAHLTASAVSPGFDCEVCHVKPADALSPGHVNTGTATVTFAGLAVNGVSPAPAWSRASATCSNTYCHGAADGATPVWTRVGQGEADCGTCHGLPPAVSHPAVPGGLTDCSGCHAPTVDASGALIAPSAGGKHLNGVVDAQGHTAEWMDTASPGFHAFDANLDAERCTVCHATAPGTSLAARSCDRCHELPTGTASWTENCVMCHGGEENATGAPPSVTWGNDADPLREGAHSKHVGATLTTPIDCGACHPKPADAFSPGHLGDGTADVTWGALASISPISPARRAVRSRCGTEARAPARRRTATGITLGSTRTATGTTASKTWSTWTCRMRAATRRPSGPTPP
jgi:predicted CxxxxCH...CXXCH cytochrome family protein